MKEELIEVVINGELVVPENKSMTTRNLLVSLGVSLGIYVSCILIFSLLRKKIRSVYEPRTFIVAKNLRMEPTNADMFGWLKQIYTIPLSEVTKIVGLDGYFFLRHIIFVILICAIIAVPSMSVLIPLHVIGNGNENMSTSLLEKISLSNIQEQNKIRHVAHVVLSAFSMCLSLFLFDRELTTYFRIKADCMFSRDEIPGSTSTLLVKGLYPEYLQEKQLVSFFSDAGPNSNNIKKVWYNRDYSALRKLAQNRERIVNKLETQEMWLLEKSMGIGKTNLGDYRNNNKDSKIVGNLWREYLQKEDLDRMKGKKGTLFTWLKGELSRLNSQIHLLQSQSESLPLTASCFIQFKDKLSCFIASRSLGIGRHITPGTHVFDKIHPADVIWNNLTVAGWIQNFFHTSATALNYLFIFGWTFPVALISMFTQAELMSQWMPQVQWLVHVPQMSNVFSSMISPLLVSALTSQVPRMFRALARLKGFPTNTLVEMDVQKHLFLFMFFQLFVIATLATGLPSLLQKILLNTNEGAITLASSLPRASTFFITYVIANNLTASGSVLLQTSQLSSYCWLKYFAKTPREHFNAIYRCATPEWGSIYPLATNTCSIGIAYALITPLILPSVIIGLLAMYIAYKYCILYCYIPRCMADGDYYPRAIFQLFSGFYCQQIALLGTLLVSQQPILAGMMVLILVLTGIGHYTLKQKFQDMKTRIPLKINKVDDEALHHLNLSEGSTKNGSFAAAEYESALTSRDDESSARNSIYVPSTPDSVFSTTSEATLVNDKAVIDIFGSIAQQFENLSSIQKSFVSSQFFEHPLSRLSRPCVWIPKDKNGVALDQVDEMQRLFPNLRASCHGAEMSPDGTFVITSPPPDVDITIV